jgi:hypothetical protein
VVIRYNGIEIDSRAQEVRHRGRVWSACREETSTFVGLQSLICGGGLSTAQLFWIMYGDDPEGGPDLGHHVIHIRLCQWRKFFEALALELRRVKTAGVIFYSLEPAHRF